MSLQTVLVRIQSSDGGWMTPGETVDRDGLDWKFQPLDPAERDEWDVSVRDDARVEEARARHGPSNWRFIPAGATPETYEFPLPFNAEGTR